MELIGSEVLRSTADSKVDKNLKGQGRGGDDCVVL